MSGFHREPYVLKKEQLKKELLANGIPLPKADQRKDFYVNLYKEHLSSQEDDPSSVDEFSSDDEDTPGSSPMGAHKVRESQTYSISLLSNLQDVCKKLSYSSL